MDLWILIVALGAYALGFCSCAFAICWIGARDLEDKLLED